MDALKGWRVFLSKYGKGKFPILMYIEKVFSVAVHNSCS